MNRTEARNYCVTRVNNLCYFNCSPTSDNPALCILATCPRGYGQLSNNDSNVDASRFTCKGKAMPMPTIFGEPTAESVLVFKQNRVHSVGVRFNPLNEPESDFTSDVYVYHVDYLLEPRVGDIVLVFNSLGWRVAKVHSLHNSQAPCAAKLRVTQIVERASVQQPVIVEAHNKQSLEKDPLARLNVIERTITRETESIARLKNKQLAIEESLRETRHLMNTTGAAIKVEKKKRAELKEALYKIMYKG